MQVQVISATGINPVRGVVKRRRSRSETKPRTG
jgi:hypothetical protein